MIKERLIDLELKKHTDGSYFLKAVYEQINEFGKYKITIPHIYLPVSLNRIPFINRDSMCFDSISNATVNFFNGAEQLVLEDEVVYSYKGKQKVVIANYVVEPIEEFCKELTLSEIESKLGYKIKLVSEEENNK